MSQGIRHQARLLAVQTLYGLDLRNEFCDDVDDSQKHRDTVDIQNVLKENIVAFSLDTDDDILNFSEMLCRGVIARRHEIDRAIDTASTNWRLSRMNVVDRNILRVAVYELLRNHADTPPPVIIDEALELAKDLAQDSSVSFINGVLSHVKLK